MRKMKEPKAASVRRHLPRPLTSTPIHLQAPVPASSACHPATTELHMHVGPAPPPCTVSSPPFLIKNVILKIVPFLLHHRLDSLCSFIIWICSSFSQEKQKPKPSLYPTPPSATTPNVTSSSPKCPSVGLLLPPPLTHWIIPSYLKHFLCLS